MKFEILQENLFKVLSTTGRFVSSKAQLPILSNYLLEVKNGQLTITATNLDLGISVMVGAKTEEDGEIVVPAKVFLETVSGLSKDKVTVSTEKLALKISSQNHRASINCLDAAEFPRPAQGKKGNTVEIDNSALVSIATQVCFAASQDEGRPALTGVLFIAQDKELDFVATDGFRLSLKKSQIAVPKEMIGNQFLIPARAILEAGRICAEKSQDEDKKVTINITSDNNQAIFAWEDTVLTTRLIDGKFPPYEKIIPQAFGTKIIVDKEELLRAVKLSSVFARDSANIIKLKAVGQKIKISANTPMVGEDESEIGITKEGEDNEIAFNSRYLIEYLNSTAGENLELKIVGPLNPCVFSVPGDNTCSHIIMPVRVQA